MGNSNSIGKEAEDLAVYGGMYIKLDQEIVSLDDTMTGTIYLDLKQQYPGEKICLNIRGYEWVFWMDRQQRSSSSNGKVEYHYVNVTRSSMNSFQNIELDVYKWDNDKTIYPGQYTFPFAFRIPAHFPGSFFFHKGNILGEIVYVVEAYLKSDKANAPKLKYGTSFSIREKAQQTNQTTELNISKPIKTWCCCKQGQVSIKTSVEKNAYAPGEELKIVIEIDNSQCSMNLKSIQFTLIQDIKLSAEGYTKKLEFPIRSMLLGSMEPGHSWMGDRRKEVSFILPVAQEEIALSPIDNTKDVRPIENSKNTTEVMTPSVDGKLIKSSFRLIVESKAEGHLCCGTNPFIEIPIQIFSVPQIRQPDLIAPVGWSPQKMPVVNLAVPGSKIPNDQLNNFDMLSGNQMPDQQYGQVQLEMANM